MVVALSERAYTCSSGRSSNARWTSATTRWCRVIPTRPAAPSTRRSDGTAAMTGSSRSPSTAGTASPTTTPIEAFRRRQPARRPPGDRSHPPDPGALRRAAPPVLRRPDLRRRPHAGEKAWAGTAVAARPVAGVRASCRRPADRDHQRPTRTDLQHALDVLRQSRLATSRSEAAGAALGLGAYVSWGLFPAFFPLLKPAGAFEVLAHRIVWTLAFMAVVVVASRRLTDLRHIGGVPGFCWPAPRP